MKLLLASALFLLAPMCAHAACSATDFSVTGVTADSGKNDDGRSVVILRGELVNNCDAPAAAQLLVVARSASGGEVASRKAWPAGTSNIAPGKSVTFNLGRLFRYTPDMKTFAIKIADVRTW